MSVLISIEEANLQFQISPAHHPRKITAVAFFCLRNPVNENHLIQDLERVDGYLAKKWVLFLQCHSFFLSLPYRYVNLHK